MDYINSLKPSRELASVVSTMDQRSSKGVYPRISVRLTDELRSAIDEIIQDTTAASPSEVVRTAVVIYHTLLTQEKNGNKAFVAVNGHDGIENVPIFGE